MGEKAYFEHEGLRISGKQFIAITFNELGVKIFTYLKDGKARKREIYFIDHISEGTFGAPMLLGQFLFQLEECPDALEMRPGGTNTIYFSNDKGQDLRVRSLGYLTEKEKERTRRRLVALAKKHPEHANRISELISLI